MADVERALAKAAAEDGGALFECRPRGWPPGWWSCLDVPTGTLDRADPTDR